MHDSERKLPVGRLGRFARLAAVGARTGASLLVSKDGAASAQAAAEVLGTLRGLAAKIGQMASYVDGVVPEKHREAYELAMKGLRAAAPRSSAAQIRAVVEEELGAPIDRLFAEFDDVPLASASIGQVHRARLAEPDGREVAVKVQHPGIARAVESDLANADVLRSMVALAGAGRFNTKEQLDIVKTRFREELDYRLEASRIAHFSRLFEGDPRVRILRVVDTRSATRVLTTELVRGATFDEACAATERERRAFAETLWRFVFRGNLVGGQFNADPHPGNYVFHDDGAVTFLDFGCVQPIEARAWRHAKHAHRHAAAGDERAFRDDVVDLIGMRPGALAKLAQDYMREAWAPIFDAPYHVTRAWTASLLDGFKDLALAARKAPADEFFQMSPDTLFLNRLQFGFYSVLARLDVTVDYRAVHRAFLPEVVD